MTNIWGAILRKIDDFFTAQTEKEFELFKRQLIDSLKMSKFKDLKIIKKK